MAKKYKSSKGNDRALMYTIIGFVSVIAILGVALIVSQMGNDTPPEDLYEYEQFQHLTDWDVVDDQTRDLYAVYLYSPSCGHCATIKQDVLEATASNSSGLKIYLLNTANATGDYSNIVLGDKTVTGTPTMLLYRDGELVELNSGTPSILSFLDDVHDGDYTN